jgi:adenylate cyclase
MAGLRDLVKELRRRHVFRAIGIYVVGAWLALQVASLVFPAINVPDAAIRYVWIAVILLFPACVVFAWFFEITPEGLKRTPPADAGEAVDLSLRRNDHLILGGLAVVAIAVAWQFTGNISEVSTDNALAVAGGPQASNFVAVLPLENLSGDPEQQYFVAGMHDALIAGLARMSELKVISKPSTLLFAGSDDPLPQIASRLGVAKLVVGSVERLEDKVRISVGLHDALEDEEIWSSTFEENIEDVLHLQDDVAQAIAAQVAGVVAQAPGIESRTMNPVAYEAFLKAQFHVERFTPQDMMLAGQYYQQALELDPEFALVHWGMTRLCGFKAQAGLISPTEAKAQCMPPLIRALRIDPFLPEAHFGYGANMTWQQFKFDEARPAFERAIELNPSYAEGRVFYSHYLGIMGELDESTVQMEMARELDPLNPFVQGLHGVQRLMVGDLQGAIDLIEASMAAAPGSGFGNDVLWGAYYDNGEPDKAIEAAIRVFTRFAPDHFAATLLEDAYTGDNFESVMLQLGELLAERFETSPVPPMDIGLAFELGGDAGRSIDWYEMAYRTGDPSTPYLGVLTVAENVRSHPRFIALLREVKLDYWADKYSQQ